MKNFLITFTAVLVAGGLLWGLNRNAALWEAEADRIVKELNEINESVTESRIEEIYIEKKDDGFSQLMFRLSYFKMVIDGANKHYSKLSIGADTHPLKEAIYEAENTYKRSKEEWSKIRGK
jgi:hypothetical protein